MNQAEISKNSLIIIDGYGFIFRAYYVQPPLTAPDGSPVGAIYGFTSMLLKLINDFKPSKAVVVLDSGGKNFRHELFTEYKANRPPAPDDLVAQLHLIQSAAKALNFPVLEMKGYEADDIIATLAIRATNEQKQAVIISSDKDLMQLVNGHIKLYDPMKAKFIDREDVINKFGVGPEKVREVQALMGDSSDNIPGVSGIGPKTAAQLIGQFGSVEALYSSIDQIKTDKQREKLLAHKDNAMLSWQLVGLECNVNLDFNLEQFDWTPPSKEIISNFLNAYGFKSLFKRTEHLFNLSLDSAGHLKAEKTAADEITFAKIDSPDELKKILLTFDTEGVVALQLLKDANETSIFLSNSHKVYQIRLSKPDELAKGQNLDFFSSNDNKDDSSSIMFALIKGFLEDSSIKKITFDLKQLIKFFGKNICAIDDLMLMDYVLSAGKKARVVYQLISDYIEEEVNFEQNAPKIVSSYLVVYEMLKQELYKEKIFHLYAELDLPVCHILNQMEANGIKIDSVRLRELSEEFNQNIKQLEKKIFLMTGEEFNIASPKQLGEVLFKKMQLPFAKTNSKSGDFATSSEILEKLSLEGHEIADLILQYRHYTKLKNTYTESLPKLADKGTHRIHTTYFQNQTTTSRLSSKDPNVQNIPIRSTEGNKIRACFVASEGHKLISADYSQIELRILSHVANVEELKKAFKEGQDIHSKTASQIFGVKIDHVDHELRRRAKAINFGIIYGISAHGLAKQLGCGRKEAGEYIERYFAAYPGIKEYMEKTIHYAKEHGYVENMLGRRCYVIDINNKNHMLRSYAERAAINAPIQGLNADIVKIAMINCSKMLKEKCFKTKMLLQIHDELVFETPDSEANEVKNLIKQTMEKALVLSVPTRIDVGVGDNWQEIH